MDVSTYCQQLCFKEPVFNYSGNFRFMDEIKIPVQYSNYELAKSIILEAVAVAGELSVSKERKWKTLQSKYS
jgi:hypothetical protein